MPTRPEKGIVDIHAHVFPEAMFRAVWNYFESFDWAVHHEYVDSIVRTFKQHGVTMAVGLSYPHKPGVAESLNRFMESVGEQVEMFRPFASVHIDDENMNDYAEAALASPHIVGFKFQPLVQYFDINHPKLDHFYKRCVEEDSPLLMHVGTAPILNEYLGFSHFKKLIERFPDLRVCIAHMGAFEFDDFLNLLDDYPQLYLDTTMINVNTSLFDTSFKGSPEKLRKHADRICFGSDWPNVPYPYQEALDSIARFPFDEEHLPGVLGDNARRFLKIK